MAIFAIGDLHLSSNGEKPMNVFGQQWDNHFATICARWQERVRPTDTVLIPGDISWAMQFEEVQADLQSIAQLPGTKILLRGNHDYWWSSISRLRGYLPAGMLALQNDSVALNGIAICGTRGWNFPTEQYQLDAQEMKIYRRELIRLQMALDSAQKTGLPILAMTHFPPLLTDHRDTEFTAMLEQYGVKLCVYGHLHGIGIQNGFSGTHRDVAYQLVSCDSIDFAPVCVWEDA
ncbi:MAG TPA: metallophosphoesterase [Candidatus Limiplasma sp.]|nr:metallophosphoesterase [Candidatus Limiplasma sp.]HPS81442.1 metallophosphoesterase [Candidatus Limiplasma sp.]